MKRNLLIVLCGIMLMPFVSMYADEDCDETLKEAKKAYNAGEYAKAKKYYDYVADICGASYGNAASWSRKCQDAVTPKLSVSRTSISVGSGSGSTSVKVTSNRTWKLANTTSSLYTVSKNGDNVTINYSANPNTSSRSDYFDVVTTDGSKSVRVRITQEAKANTEPYLTVSETSISASASGTTKTLTVSSNIAWEVQYPSATMYSVTRNGNTLTVTIHANATTERRTDYFNVKATDGSKVQKISLSQSASSSSDPYLTVSQTSISASSSGTTKTLTVSSNIAWEVQYPSGTMYSVTRSGNTLTVTIHANTTTERRTDYFNVKATDGSKVQKISLSQSAGSSSQKSATVHSMTIDHNVMNDGEKCMKIHTHFTVYNMKSQQIYVIAWLYDNDGNNQTSYSTVAKYDRNINNSHSVLAWETVTPRYDDSEWKDFVLYLPNALISKSGYVVVEIRDYSTGNTLKKSEKATFTLNN